MKGKRYRIYKYTGDSLKSNNKIVLSSIAGIEKNMTNNKIWR